MFKQLINRHLISPTKIPKAFFSSSIKFQMFDSKDQWFDCEGEVGESLMTVGLRAGVKFEVACGGNAECCTCHVKLKDDVLQSQDYLKP